MKLEDLLQTCQRYAVTSVKAKTEDAGEVSVDMYLLPPAATPVERVRQAPEFTPVDGEPEPVEEPPKRGRDGQTAEEQEAMFGVVIDAR